jgi:hypothetical protein
MESKMEIKGTLNCEITLKAEDLDKVIIEGLHSYKESYENGNVIISGRRSNTFVDIGLNNVILLFAGLGGSPISHIGVTNNADAVTASTTKLDPNGTDSVTIELVQNLTVINSVMSGEGVFTHLNAAFPYRKIGFLNTSTDAGTGLADVIGGGGVAPYDKPFFIDLTGAGTWNAKLGIDVEFKKS